jgi:sugar (glycoside-pentoside-hexuronide) transporter
VRQDSLAATVTPAAPLSTRAIVDYSLPSFGSGFLFILVNIYLLKYTTDVLLIAPATMGLLFGLSRLWDAVADPAVGFLTDRTRSRLGRRRPWILASALPLGATFAMLFAPPRSLEGTALLVWMAAALFVFYTAVAMLETAHAALGAELTDAYHERTRVFGVRRIVFGLGSLLAVGAITAFSNTDAPRETALAIGLFGGVVAAAASLWTVAHVRERPEFQDRGATNPYRAFRDVWRNPHARLLLLVFLLQQLGVVALTTIMPFFSEYVLETPEWTSVYIGALFIAATLGVPVWVRFRPRGGKKAALIWAMALIGCAIATLGLAEPGAVALTIAMCSLGGFASAGTDVLFPSIQADAIDWDELQTGERKEGAYFAAWAFASKGAGALASTLVGFALSGIGFVPNAVQTDEVRTSMLLLAAIAPAFLYAVSVLIFLRFSLGEAQHAEIQKALRGSQPSVPPSATPPAPRPRG